MKTILNELKKRAVEREGLKKLIEDLEKDISTEKKLIADKLQRGEEYENALAAITSSTQKLAELNSKLEKAKEELKTADKDNSEYGKKAIEKLSLIGRDIQTIDAHIKSNTESLKGIKDCPEATEALKKKIAELKKSKTKLEAENKLAQDIETAVYALYDKVDISKDNKTAGNNSKANSKKEEEKNSNRLKLIKSFVDYIAVDLPTFPISVFGKRAWKEIIREEFFSKLKIDGVEAFTDFIVSEYAVRLKLSSQIFNVFVEELNERLEASKNDGEVAEKFYTEKIKAVMEAETIKTEILGREPVAAKHEPEYTAVVKKYLKAVYFSDEDILKKISAESQFIFNDEKVIEKYFG